jgi:hypothetical protein
VIWLSCLVSSEIVFSVVPVGVLRGSTAACGSTGMIVVEPLLTLLVPAVAGLSVYNEA